MDNKQRPDDGGYWRRQLYAPPDVAARAQSRQADFTPKVKDNTQPAHKFPRPPVPAEPQPPAAASGPNAPFDFILKQQQQKPPSGLAGWLPNVSRNMKIAGGAVIGLLLVLIITSVFSGGPTQTDRLVGIMAQDEEILRVTQLYQDRFQDPLTTNIALTAKEAINTNLALMSDYLVKNKLKYKQQALVARTNKQTDVSLNNAMQNNNLDGAYLHYLQTALNNYQQSLSSVYKTSGPNMKKILQASFSSIKVVLSSTQFSKASNS